MSCVSLPWLCWFQMWNLWIQNPCYHENHVRSEIAVQSDVLPSSCDQQSTCCYQVAVGTIVDVLIITQHREICRVWTLTASPPVNLPCSDTTMSPQVNLPYLDTYRVAAGGLRLDTYNGDCHHHWCWWWLMMVGICRERAAESINDDGFSSIFTPIAEDLETECFFKYQIMSPTQTLRWNFCGDLMMKPQIHVKCWISSRQQHSKRSLNFIILFVPRWLFSPWAVSLQILL